MINPMSPQHRRSKRRAALEAGKKIEKIFNDDTEDEHKSHSPDPEDPGTKQQEVKIENENDGGSPFFRNAILFRSDDIEPKSDLSLSNSSLSVGSLTSIPEAMFSFSGSSTKALGSAMTPLVGFGSDELSFNYETDREEHRTRRLVNSTGTVYLSAKTGYRMSLHSPQTSPIRPTKLSFTPFVGPPTTPAHVYQYRPRDTAATGSGCPSTRAVRTSSSPLPRRRIFPSANGGGRGRTKRGIAPHWLA